MSDSENNSEYNFKEDINNEILIKEVQKRPALYDRTIKEFSDAPAKKKIWQEICGMVYRKWPLLSKSQQYSAEIELLKRWKNLRGCYAREVKIQQNPKRYKKRRKYIYYDKLRFLDPFLELNMRKSAQEDNDDDVASEPGNIKLEMDLKEDEDSGESSYMPERFIEVDTNMLDLPMTSSHQKRKRVNSEEYDSDTHFALSLVPLLASLPMSRKITAQIEILQTLKKLNGIQQ